MKLIVFSLLFSAFIFIETFADQLPVFDNAVIYHDIEAEYERQARSPHDCLHRPKFGPLTPSPTFPRPLPYDDVHRPIRSASLGSRGSSRPTPSPTFPRPPGGRSSRSASPNFIPLSPPGPYPREPNRRARSPSFGGAPKPTPTFGKFPGGRFIRSPSFGSRGGRPQPSPTFPRPPSGGFGRYKREEYVPERRRVHTTRGGSSPRRI